MTRIAKISLDIRKTDVIENEPIILRQGESDVIIEASISNDGYPNLEIGFATFVAKKPDGTIISNDPVNVDGGVIDYPISKHLTESVGKIQDAYFMINNQITTCGFDISIIPSTQLDGTSVNYVPGLENINKFLKSTEEDWLGRIQKMKSQIAGLDIPAEFKLLMDKALDEAKAQYQPIIDGAEENVDSIVADLSAKKLDLESNSDELNKAILDIKAQVASITSFLDGIQKQIIEANSSFTAGQQDKVSQSIADGQKKLADSIASMQNKFESDSKNLKSQSDQVIADLKSSSNTAIKDMQENQSTVMAKVSQDVVTIKENLQQANGTIQDMEIDTRNLLRNTSSFSDQNQSLVDSEEFEGTKVLKNPYVKSPIENGNDYIDTYDSVMTVPATNDYYAASFWAKADNAGDKMACYFYNKDEDTVIDTRTSQGVVQKSIDGNITISLSTKMERYWIIWHQKGTSNIKHVNIGRVRDTFNNEGPIYVSKPDLVEGTKPVLNHQNAPEDFSKVTAENGDVEYRFYKENTTDFKKALWDLPLGFHTVYVEAGTINNPSRNSLRGHIHITDKNNGNHIGNGILVDSANGDMFSINISCPSGTIDYSDKTSVIFNMLVKDSNTSNWQKQKIFQDGGYYYDHCLSGKDFGSFLESSSVPVGLSIIRDENSKLNWMVIKETGGSIYGSTVDINAQPLYFSVLSGKYSGIKSMMNLVKGKTLKAKDQDGKELTLTIE